jgi:heat shock protein beta
MLLLILGMLVVNILPVGAQDDITITDKALRNALIEICYGTRVMVDLNDPAQSEVSLEEAGLSAETRASLIADAAQTDGSYESLSDLLIVYCLGADVTTAIWTASGDAAVIETILVDAGVQNIEWFFIEVREYVYMEQWVYAYFESNGFTEEQYAAIFFALQFGTSTDVTSLLVDFGVDAEAASEFAVQADNMVDEIEAEDSPDDDGDGILDVEDTDDDEDGVEDVEDTDDDGDGVEDADQDDDLDNDGVDDAEDDDSDGDGIDDEEDEDADNDGVDDDDADGDGVEDEEDTDDDGDGTEDSEDGDDDGDGQDEGEDDSMVGDDEGGDEGGDEE